MLCLSKRGGDIQVGAVVLAQRNYFVMSTNDVMLDCTLRLESHLDITLTTISCLLFLFLFLTLP